MSHRPTAIVADDEPLLRSGLIRELVALWPDLRMSQARNGREVVEQFRKQPVDICFLDVQMPVKTGLEAAKEIRTSPRGEQAHLVFVTAFDEHAIEAFVHGAMDYLVKPVDRSRLQQCVDRLRTRLAEQKTPAADQALLRELADRLRSDGSPSKWLHAQSGNATHVIAIDDIEFARADTKYTRIAWRDAAGNSREALLRKSLRDLYAELPTDRFVQIHRSVIVNRSAIDHVLRGDNETAEVRLRHREETLPVSRRYAHVFRES